MKHILTFSILAALLGGCVVTPVGYGDSRDGYYGERGYNRSDGYYRNRDYNRGDGSYREYDYRGDYGNQGSPFQQHGH